MLSFDFIYNDATNRIFDFFGVRSIFISSNEHQKLYFHEYTGKIIFSVSFMLQFIFF